MSGIAPSITPIQSKISGKASIRCAEVSAPEEYPTEMTLPYDAPIAGRVAVVAWASKLSCWSLLFWMSCALSLSYGNAR